MGVQNHHQIVFNGSSAAAQSFKLGIQFVADSQHCRSHNIVVEIAGSAFCVSPALNRGGTCATYRPEHVAPAEWGRLDIICGLGGLAAFDLVFGEHDTGASDDLEKVRDMVKRRIEDYGTSGFGLLCTGYPNSTTLISHVENAVAIELERQFRRTKQVLAANRDFLDALTEAIETQDYLLASDIAAIRGRFDIVPFEL